MDATTEIAALDQPPETALSVPLEPPRAPVAANKPSEDTNMVDSLTEEEQKLIVDQVIRDYDADVDSRKPRMMRLKEAQGLYASVMKAKSFPFKNSANINLPLLARPWLQIQGRLYDMVWPADGKVFYSSFATLADAPIANITETFGNSYIRHKMPEMSQGMDDTLHQTCGYGSGFRKTYWNGYEGRVCSDWIPIEDFVVAHGQRSQDPSMRDVPRYTHVQRPTYFKMEGYSIKGIYANFDKVKLTEPDQKAGTEFSKQLEKIDGQSAATGDTTVESQERFVLEQYFEWRTPDAPKAHASFDGKPHAVVATVDEQSRTLLRFIIREEPDPDDFARFTKETAAFDGHLQQLEAYVRESQAAQTVQDTVTQMGAQLPPDFQMPQPPALPPNLKADETGMPVQPEPQRVRPISLFTHYRAFPSEGFYGLGLCDFMGGANKAVNTILNQTIDRGTLANGMGGFISAQLKGQRGSVNMQPGELVEIDAPMGSIKDGFFFPQLPPADPSNMRIAQMILEEADKMVASSDMMSGQTSGANRTAKEAQILSEQMMMQITVLARRIKEAFKHELDKIWRCWGVFLPDEEIVDLIGHDNEPTQVKIGRAMFTPNAHIQPAADPRTKTQKREEAMQVFGLVTNNPYLMNSPPPVRDALMRAVTEDVLRAHNAEKLVKLLPPLQPPGPPPPPPPAPYWEENAGFVRGQDHPVNKDDNDQEHIQGHTMHKASPAYAIMDKVGKDMLDKHIRFHVAQDIEKTGQKIQQLHQHLMGGTVQPAPMPPQMGAMPQ